MPSSSDTPQDLHTPMVTVNHSASMLVVRAAQAGNGSGRSGPVYAEARPDRPVLGRSLIALDLALANERHDRAVATLRWMVESGFFVSRAEVERPAGRPVSGQEGADRG